MEADEVGETITETAEHGHGRAAHAERNLEDDRFRRWTGIILGVLAMMLAIASLGGEDATKETINANIKASDAYAYYQAKDIRQTDNRLAADTLESLLQSNPQMPADAKAAIEKHIADDRAAAARYESDPEARNGKKELLAQAHGYDERRERAQRRDVNFDYARALFQIAIVLGSVSIVAASRPLLAFGLVLAVLASVLTLNGFFLIFELPLAD